MLRWHVLGRLDLNKNGVLSWEEFEAGTKPVDTEAVSEAVGAAQAAPLCSMQCPV